MTTFSPAWEIEQTSFIWQRIEGEWHRHLVRRTTSGQVYWSSLVHVVADRPVCLACLGQTVVIIPHPSYPEGYLTCHECGVRYGFL